MSKHPLQFIEIPRKDPEKEIPEVRIKHFDEIYEYIFVQPSKKIGYFFWKKIDVSFIDKFGPDGLSQLIKYLSLKAVKFQSGYIYQYAFVMLIGFSILLTLLLVN